MGARLLRIVTCIYLGGYFAYMAAAAFQAWPKTTWPEWWMDLALQAGWYGALWPYYLPRLL
jgi:hypothetical protein